MIRLKITMTNPIDGSAVSEIVDVRDFADIFFMDRFTSLLKNAFFSMAIEPIPHGNSLLAIAKAKGRIERHKPARKKSKRPYLNNMGSDKEWEGRVLCHFSVKTCPICIVEFWRKDQCDDHISEVHKIDAVQKEEARKNLRTWCRSPRSREVMAGMRKNGCRPADAISALKALWRKSMIPSCSQDIVGIQGSIPGIKRQV